MTVLPLFAVFLGGDSHLGKTVCYRFIYTHHNIATFLYQLIFRELMKVLPTKEHLIKRL